MALGGGDEDLVHSLVFEPTCRGQGSLRASRPAGVSATRCSACNRELVANAILLCKSQVRVGEPCTSASVHGEAGCGLTPAARGVTSTRSNRGPGRRDGS